MGKGDWKDSELRELFESVESVKADNKPLKEAFILHANKYSRKPNSVRNFYYFALDQLKNDLAKTKRLGIDLGKHSKNKIEYFSSKEEEELALKIEKLVKSGMSIRKACFQISGGDVNLMLRYQNKYRNFVAKKKPLPNNIIAFTGKKSLKLTENDINSLFLGLVRLVKRNATEEVEAKTKFERENANQALRSALVDINKKERELDKLKEELLRLKTENSRLRQNMMKLKCQKATKMLEKEKVF